MSKILVTGASGDIGRKTLLHLLKRRPAGELIGLARDPSKAADLAAKGVEIRRGEYLEPASLAEAFKGVDKLMLTSTHAFTDRKTAHANVIDEAVKAGVKHLVYMPIYRKPGSTFHMAEITDEDIFTVDRLKASGLTWTLAKHPPFMEPAAMYGGVNPLETGVRVPPGEAKFTAATRDDLAAAHAAILSGTGHENKEYYLSGHPAVSYRDIAGILSKVHGKEVPFITVSDEEYVEIGNGLGFPPGIAEFILKWVQGMNAGEWAEETGDLARLIGHQPTTFDEFFAEAAKAAQAAPTSESVT